MKRAIALSLLILAQSSATNLGQNARFGTSSQISAQTVSYNLYVKSGIISLKIGTGQYTERNVSSNALPKNVANVLQTPAPAGTGAAGSASAGNGTSGNGAAMNSQNSIPDHLRRVDLTMSSGSGASMFYQINDTLTSFQTTDGKGLYYRKATHENKRHDVETAIFTRATSGTTTGNTSSAPATTPTNGKGTTAGTYAADLKAVSSDGKLLGQKRVVDSQEIYDLLSMISMLRALNSSQLRPGKTIEVPMVNGLTTVTQYIKYEGSKKVKADDGKTYNCIEISIHDFKYGDERETLRACVTNDSRHMPVQMDLVFTLGAIRCNLASYKE